MPAGDRLRRNAAFARGIVTYGRDGAAGSASGAKRAREPDRPYGRTRRWNPDFQNPLENRGLLRRPGRIADGRIDKNSQLRDSDLL